jgi:hypothetical protein
LRGDTDRPRTKRRGRRTLWWTLGSIGALLIVSVIGIVIWSQVGVSMAEPEPLAAVRDDPGIRLTDTSSGIVMEPAGGTATGEGLVFIPGGKVDPWAYASKLSGLVRDAGVTVVITKPWLNLAFFDVRPLSTFTGLAPDVVGWMVGGHSLGGVRACMMATDAEALVLFASYCSADVSGSGLPVLSLSGSEDALSSPQDIANARELLPDDASMVEIPGASHSSFGDYGLQPGDGTPTIGDEEMIGQITATVGALAEAAGG